MEVTASMKLRIVFAVFALVAFEGNVFAKPWRGIVPLISTRADVERLLGKPNDFGLYEMNGEAASVIYSDGPCQGLYRSLEKVNCKCLVAKDTVLSIFVEPRQFLKFSGLGITKPKFTRTAIVSGPGMFSYSDLNEGIVYSVDETRDEVIDMEFLPSFSDCRRLMATTTPVPRNSWRGLMPLHSDRRKVEQLLGKAGSSSGVVDVHTTETEKVTVRYSAGVCGDTNVQWDVRPGTVLEVTVTPLFGFPLDKLDLDFSLFKRQSLGRLPEIPQPPDLVNYVNSRDGVTIRAKQVSLNAEEVVSITYGPSAEDNKLRCRVP
jgi:hypothetical protein